MDADTARQMDECRASIARLNGEVLAAIDSRDFTKADKLDRQRSAVQRLLAKHCTEQGTPQHRAEARRLLQAARS